MSEISEILSAWHQCVADGVGAALATVVRVDGSAYRRPGARMLILGDGRTVGVISGGCLERDVVYRSGAVRATGIPTIVRYDAVSEQDAGPAAALGCGGTIEILIESLTPENAQPLESLEWLWSRRQRGFSATVIAQQSTDARIGDRITLDESGLQQPADVHPHGHRWAIPPAPEPGILHLPTPAGWIEFFIERIEPPLQLFIFGGSADSAPLAAQARNLGWHVTLIDMRTSVSASPATDEADITFRCAANELAKIEIHQHSAVIIKNHHWQHDLAALQRVVNLNLKYLGILGPKSRTERLFQYLGVNPPNSAALHYPIGLDLGAETPREVALSVVAEILSVVRNTRAVSLRDKNGPIHTPMHGPDRAENPCPAAAS